jgi:hypothetical protein
MPGKIARDAGLGGLSVARMEPSGRAIGVP